MPVDPLHAPPVTQPHPLRPGAQPGQNGPTPVDRFERIAPNLERAAQAAGAVADYDAAIKELLGWGLRHMMSRDGWSNAWLEGMRDSNNLLTWTGNGAVAVVTGIIDGLYNIGGWARMLAFWGTESRYQLALLKRDNAIKGLAQRAAAVSPREGQKLAQNALDEMVKIRPMFVAFGLSQQFEDAREEVLLVRKTQLART